MAERDNFYTLSYYGLLPAGITIAFPFLRYQIERAAPGNFNTWLNITAVHLLILIASCSLLKKYWGPLTYLPSRIWARLIRELRDRGFINRVEREHLRMLQPVLGLSYLWGLSRNAAELVMNHFCYSMRSFLNHLFIVAAFCWMVHVLLKCRERWMDERNRIVDGMHLEVNGGPENNEQE